MSFTSFTFFAVFFPSVLILYYLSFKSVKLQNLILLIFSVVFYGSYGIKHLFLLALCICITWFGGIIGEKAGKKAYIIATIINLLLLILFKYTNFFVNTINAFLVDINVKIIEMPTILLPVGLSFYIFQSTSYLMDLYNGNVKMETNIINYALFVSFFPSIISGPIQKSKGFLPQIRTRRSLSFEKIQTAFLIFLYGAFIKMVLADRIAILTNQVFDNYRTYEGIILLIAALGYSIQIYADFSGYSYMAVAVAAAFGFEFEENFRQPYFAKSIIDFWRRWHISLTSWFREYLYFPLGGNRKGKLRQYINIFIVFLISGLWHGAAWHYVIWGGIHAVLQILGKVTLPVREKTCNLLKVDRKSIGYKLWQCLSVFIIVTATWIFFRAPSLSEAIDYIKRMIGIWNPWVLFDGTLTQLGLSYLEFNIVFMGLLVLAIVSYMKEKGFNSRVVIGQNIIFRWTCYLVLIFATLILGIYGPDYSSAAFIYAGF